jgi:hypothetical protein
MLVIMVSIMNIEIVPQMNFPTPPSRTGCMEVLLFSVTMLVLVYD